MTTFKNKNFIKRDYEITNLVFIQTENLPSQKEDWYSPEQWVKCDGSEINSMNCQKLEVRDIQGERVQYYGYL